MVLLSKVWINNKLIDFDDAKIHIMSHALHYGTACFEGIHSYKTGKWVAIFRLREHVDRLFESSKPLGMDLKYTQEDIFKAIKNLVKINKIDDGYIRPIIYSGYGSLDVYTKDIKPSLAIMAVKWKSEQKGPIKVKTSSFKRVNPDASIFGAKISGFYANSVMAMHEARQKGYDEALMLDSKGLVAEGPSHNVFLVKDGKILTSSSKSILPGITRLSLITLSKDLGFEVLEKEITLDEIKDADEVFYCGTLSETIPVIKIDEKIIGKGIGKVTKKLREEFQKIIRGENPKYDEWLDYV